MIILRSTTLHIPPVKFLKFGTSLIPLASITSRDTRGGPAPLPKPFPYKEKKFKWYHAIFDKTIIKTSQENARIIVVEGPIGVGKSAFCQALAEQFDMHYIPQPNMDNFYVLPSGYDLRQHDDELPEILRSYDHKNFCVNPKDVRAPFYQVKMLYNRFFQYIDALCHLLNTGQGVILERSYYSDYVFLNAMYEQNFISKSVKAAYEEIKTNTSTLLLHPHLVIYLDIPVAVVQERIRTRNYSYEQNSPALTKEYLTCLEKYWKQHYLREASKSSEILIYDWSDGGDIDVVIDDIEKLDFDIMRKDLIFHDWWRLRKNLTRIRTLYTNRRYKLEQYFEYKWYKTPELYIHPAISNEFDKLLSSLPECKYDMGYNPLMGDSIANIIFRCDVVDHRHPRPHLVYNDYTD